MHHAILDMTADVVDGGADPIETHEQKNIFLGVVIILRLVEDDGMIRDRGHPVILRCVRMGALG
eukprot:5289549-Pyramimonas_sp.AAC.1